MVSIGITAVAGSGAGDSSEPLRAADSAMYVAKQNGGNQAVVYQSPQHDRIIRQHTLEQSLFKALERKELSLAYQPQVALLTGSIVGFEALMRWRHPVLGPVSPAEFIPLAEKLGLIHSMGAWALEQALQVVQTWRELFRRDYKVSVNISVQQMMKADCASQVATLLESTGVPPGALCLEITEGILMHDHAVQQVTKLRAMGVRISIDDFGTGYSSLGQLHRLPVQTLKIDRSFIERITEENGTYAIVQAIIFLAHSLNLKVVAEGVEREDQLASLQELDCDMYQGYLFSPPVPAAAAATLLRDGRRTPLSINLLRPRKVRQLA
jgi:EAL domain-containing protein (putative c-di-GMP-specific phosphodiesterase class I)